MTAKEYLRELKKLDTCINQKMQEKAALYSSTIGAARMDTVPVHGGGPSAVVEKTIERLEEMEAEINRQIDSFTGQRHMIIDQIQGLSSEAYISVLYKRYVEFKRLEEIAVEMGYTYKYVSRVHGYALQEFYRVHEAAITKYEAEKQAAYENGGTK